MKYEKSFVYMINIIVVKKKKRSWVFRMYTHPSGNTTTVDREVVLL